MNLLKKLFDRGGGTAYVRRYAVQTEAERAHAELQRDMALANIDEKHPLWQAVISLVDEHADSEQRAALAPNLTNEQRQFTAGCAATADYLAQMLRDARLMAAQRLAKQKRTE